MSGNTNQTHCPPLCDTTGLLHLLQQRQKEMAAKCASENVGHPSERRSISLSCIMNLAPTFSVTRNITLLGV
jgi:hypothetical protein